MDSYLPSQQQTSLRIEIDKGLPPLALKVLDVLGFIQHQIVPPLSPKGKCILNRQLVGSNDYVVGIGFGPTCAQFFSPLGCTIVTKNLESWTESFQFRFPIQHNGRWYHNQVRAPNALEACQVSEQRNCLQGLSEKCSCEFPFGSQVSL